MKGIEDRNISGDHGLQIDKKKKIIVNGKSIEIECLFGIWFIINGIIS